VNGSVRSLREFPWEASGFHWHASLKLVDILVLDIYARTNGTLLQYAEIDFKTSRWLESILQNLSIP